MKKLINILILTVLFLTSCGDDGYVHIVSLNTFGDKVCRNDNVKVFVSVETDWEEEPSFNWGCNGGSLTNPQGLYENLWKSPDVPGEYEIWVEVESGGVKEKRSTIITVTDELFYTDFETPYYSEGYTNTSMTLKQSSNALQLTSSKDKGVFQRNWDNEAVAPYSMQMQYNPQTFSSGKTIDFRIAFTQLDETNKVLRDINFSVEPTSGKALVYSQYFNKQTGEIETLESEVGTLSELKFTKSWKYISVSLDASNKFIVYFDGVKLVETNFLKENFPQSAYPIKGSGVAMSNKAVVLLDDMTVMDNGEICNATARIR